MAAIAGIGSTRTELTLTDYCPLVAGFFATIAAAIAGGYMYPAPKPPPELSLVLKEVLGSYCSDGIIDHIAPDTPIELLKKAIRISYELKSESIMYMIKAIGRPYFLLSIAATIGIATYIFVNLAISLAPTVQQCFSNNGQESASQ